MKRVLTILLITLIWAVPGRGSPETTPAEVEQLQKQALAADQQAAEEARKWSTERAALLAEISRLKGEGRWLELQSRKYEKYIESQERVLAELDRREAELTRINRELEPYLEEVLARLDGFIRGDLGFLAEERSKRLAFLRDSLDDYRLTLGEKLGRVLEALRVEAEYGRSVEVTEAEIELDGRPVRVNLLRLGRLGLYYLTPDGRMAGWMSPADGRWRPLGRTGVREVGRAVEMAGRRRAVELVTLPVGRPGR